MRHGILSCVSDASLRDAARTMALHHVHTIMVSDPADGSILGLVTDSSLLDALLDPDYSKRPLGEIADREPGTISTSEPLVIAAESMRDHGIAHLIVSDPHTGNPIRMLSILDVAGILAWDEV
jgi:CBS domain-containing protein